MKKEDLKVQLVKTQYATLQFFELSDEELQKQYAPGKWTIKQILHHLTDAETVLYERLRRVISESQQQVLWVFDQDKWSEELNYTKFPLEISLDIYKATRRAVIYLLDQHYDTKKDAIFVHSKTGLRTLKEEFQKTAWHNEHHLNQIRQALNVE